MQRWTEIVTACCLGTLLGAGLGCRPLNTGTEDQPSAVYNRYNIHWYSKGDKLYASYANYVDPPSHGLFPYNTKLTVGRYRRGFLLTNVASGQALYFQYSEGNMGGLSVAEYLDLITSPTPVSYDFTPEEQEAVRAGQVRPGMRKEAVLAAWGYPARHRTPSLDGSTWTYWQNRWATVRVVFDAEGTVSQVVR